MERNELIEKLNKWIEKLNQQQEEEYKDNPYKDLLKNVYDYSEGKKYFKVFYGYGNGNGKSVFAFMDSDGNIYKPSGWNVPAKGVRATIDNPPMLSAQLYRKF